MIDLDGKKIIYNRDWRTDPDEFAAWKEENIDNEELEFLSDTELEIRFCEYIDDMIYDEMTNLDKELDGKVAVFGYNGLWHGVYPGMILPFPPRWSDSSPYNLNCIFAVEDPFDGAVWYVSDEDGNGEEDVFMWRPEHDRPIDGTLLIFRLMDEDLVNALENGNQEIGDEEWFRENSSSLAPYVAQIYGW